MTVAEFSTILHENAVLVVRDDTGVIYTGSVHKDGFADIMNRTIEEVDVYPNVSIFMHGFAVTVLPQNN